MPPRQKSLTRGRWRAFALSLLLHSCIVAAAVFGWFTWKHRPPPTQTLAIEATVVDESTLGKQAPPTPQPELPPPEPVPEPEPEPPPEEQGPPKPDPAEIEKKQEEERLAAEKLEQEKLEAEKQEAERVAAERKAAAEKVAAEKRAAEKKKADEAAAKKAADEKARLAREAELRRSLEAEERVNSMRNSAEAARWHASIVAKIQRAWIRPPSAQPGIECIVSVTQVPGGEVTAVKVISCNGGDAALRESVEAAVLRATPLPSPPDPALFERNLELTFAPTS
jgi:colicin import membrane protein